LLAERGIVVSYESIRSWCLKFGPRYQRSLKKREGKLGDDWYVDEVFVSIGGKQHYLMSVRVEFDDGPDDEREVIFLAAGARFEEVF